MNICILLIYSKQHMEMYMRDFKHNHQFTTSKDCKRM